MSLYTSDSKTVVETKSYFGDFSDVLVLGETITSQTVTVTVFSGDDLNPSNLLYQGISVHTKSIEQRIRLGIPGNIYSIKFEIGTSFGNIYDKVTRLAVLPETGSAVPSFTSIWVTSWNYPYNTGDNIQGYTGINPSNLWYQPYLQDEIQTTVSIVGGNLFVGSVSYTCVPDTLKGDISITSGILILGLLTYNFPPETIKGDIAILTGNIYSGLVSYNNVAENIKGDISISSGILI